MAVDSLVVGEALCSMPEQLASAHERAGRIDRIKLPDAGDFDHIVTLGMGGSGIVGDILQAAGTASLPVPLTVLKNFRTPAFVGRRTLAFAVSYSGDTEETLEMARGAHAAGARLITVSRGGALADFALEHDLLHVGCPADDVCVTGRGRDLERNIVRTEFHRNDLTFDCPFYSETEQE